MVFNLGFADTGEFNISDYYCVMCLFLALEKEPIALTELNISASSNSLYIIVSCVCFVICVAFCEIVLLKSYSAKLSEAPSFGILFVSV